MSRQQLDMFGEFERQSMCEAALSRKSDPETSHNAAPRGPSLLQLRNWFLDELYIACKPLTAFEVEERAAAKHTFCVESVRKRAKELVRLGEIEECESRICNNRLRLYGSRRKCTTYRVKTTSRPR